MMRTTLLALLGSCTIVAAQTEERLDRKFSVQPTGKLVVDVEFGSIDISTNGSSEVQISVFRKVTRSTKEQEETFLHEHQVSLTQEGDVITISSPSKKTMLNGWRGTQKTEGKYTINVPANFSAKLKTAGGAITVDDLAGGLAAETSGGALRFERLHGTVLGRTSGGNVRVSDSQGSLSVHTSGGGIDVSGGTGSLEGRTSGGSVTVRDFHGPAQVETTGGNIKVENVVGKVEGSTSGGSITARFASAVSDEIRLETTGGGVTLSVPETSAFDLDASTSGGSVHSDLPVAGSDKPQRNHVKGPVNGGGKAVLLRTSGGSIRVTKS